MLEVRFRRDSRNRLSSVFAAGHANWADYGDDVVCAAVSAILQAAWLGLVEHAQIALDADRSSGNLQLIVPPEERDRDDVRAILATAELAVEQIAFQYPAFVRAARENDPE